MDASIEQKREMTLTPLASVSSISSRVSTFESEDASTGDDWSVVSGEVTGTPFSSEQHIIVEKNTHDVGHMMDSLALQALFARLDTSLDSNKAGKLIEAASAETGKSYEFDNVQWKEAA